MNQHTNDMKFILTRSVSEESNVNLLAYASG